MRARRRGYRSRQEPFFVFKDRSPVKPEHVRKVLKEVLIQEGYEVDLYNCYSFRGRRSQDLSLLGVSIEVIKCLGRWSSKSNAVYTYLK